MWKNGKEGNTEGRRIMEGTDGSGRWETIEAEEKTEPRKGGSGRRGKGSGGTGKKRGAAGTSSGKQSGRKQNNCGMA